MNQSSIELSKTLHDTPQYQFRLKSLLFAFFVCAIAVAVAAFLHRAYRNVIWAVEDTYAIGEVTEILIYYIKTHKGAPPRDWQDLNRAYRLVDSGYNMFSWQELRTIVGIDFDGLAARLNASDKSHGCRGGTRLVFFKKSGRSELAEAEANERLCKQVNLSAH